MITKEVATIIEPTPITGNIKETLSLNSYYNEF